jgi:hypothetical protein
MMSNDNPSGTGNEGDSTEAALPLEQRIEIQRVEIAKAMSIIEACRLGGDSMLAPIRRGDAGDDGDDDDGGDGERDTVHFEGALCAANDILDDVLAALETISHEAP